MACSSGRLAFVFLLAFSAVVAESVVAERVVAKSADPICMLALESLPLVSKGSELTANNGKLCLLCEQYSTEALLYLQQNETQAKILSILHHACAHLDPLRQQKSAKIGVKVNLLLPFALSKCITLVDYYIPLLFVEASVVKPEDFCASVHLCKMGMIHWPTSVDTCGICHHVLVEVLTMLKDPNMKLEIVRYLLKTCSKAENYAPQCKRLVIEYILLILVKTQKYLETTDFCSSIHACKTATQATVETMPLSAAS